MAFKWPLMKNNITIEDRNALIEFLKKDSILTQSQNVKEFEKEWSEWLGAKYSVFVNSGASANLLSIAVIKHLFGTGEIIVPTLTWVSDIASVLNYGFKPVFVDVNPKTLGMDENEIMQKISPDTKAIFLTHVLGFNALSKLLLDELKDKNIPLIEDVCESHGASFMGRKLGTYGLMSNFSFYYAHHMTSVEGGMICTNDERVYQMLRMLRSHGLVREADSEKVKDFYKDSYPDTNPEFLFAYPAFNVRSTELNAVIARKQLKRLDENNARRVKNFQYFLDHLDPIKYRTDFSVEGSVNYAFILILKNADDKLRHAVIENLRDAGIEFRRGTTGGGNQLRQPYLEGIVPKDEYKKYPEVEHIHFYGFYIGNYPELKEKEILSLCELLNQAGD
ncbi:MAG: aminotransferase class I/II-fold pyridoxal phosphate-dependent enzyme [Syntrophomonadaceae bacterium]|nr:aminotransferase class I/II-fold pyridoxal phosphate-dependent enzyme [Syntrophomonadaceae bacterium]MDD3023985.1 aminotransferase class I/II-fold pyridoxal phosphate-dependent enzyme [Syntrophomonadaceae bacterium]